MGRCIKAIIIGILLCILILYLLTAIIILLPSKYVLKKSPRSVFEPLYENNYPLLVKSVEESLNKYNTPYKYGFIKYDVDNFEKEFPIFYYPIKNYCGSYLLGIIVLDNSKIGLKGNPASTLKHELTHAYVLGYPSDTCPLYIYRYCTPIKEIKHFGHYYASPIELDARIADLKRFYYLLTGKLVIDQNDAQQMFIYLKEFDSKHKFYTIFCKVIIKNKKLSREEELWFYKPGENIDLICSIYFASSVELKRALEERACQLL